MFWSQESEYFYIFYFLLYLIVTENSSRICKIIIFREKLKKTLLTKINVVAII